jgi:uncharacterized protein DUF4332
MVGCPGGACNRRCKAAAAGSGIPRLRLENSAVLELAERNPEHLHARLVEVNDAHHHVNVVPGAEHVKHWVEEAKALPRVVQY